MRPAPELNGPEEQAARFERDQRSRAITAVADVYVLTNQIRDLLEDRLEAIARAFANGASGEELARAVDGSDHPGCWSPSGPFT